MSDESTKIPTVIDAEKDAKDTIEAGPSAGSSNNKHDQDGAEEGIDENDPAYAKQLYARGSRNYLVKNYAQAADQLSEACVHLERIHGTEADELAMPFLLYAKVLIALAQSGENAVLKEEEIVPEESGSEDDDDDDEDGEADGADGGDDNGKENTPNADKSSENDKSQNTAANKENIDNETPDEDADNSPVANLQIAWEVLEVAARIFERQGEPSTANLADALFELAEISLEDSHFEEAIRDYTKALEIHMKLSSNNLRIIAEIEYKIGLSNLMINEFDKSVIAFRKAIDVLDAEIASQQSEALENSTKVNSTVGELEELKLEILNKITEVEEAKQQSLDNVKVELAKIISLQPSNNSNGSNTGASSSGAAGSLSSSSTSTIAATKATDISHLVKRKKPDAVSTAAEAADEESPAKKATLD